MAVDPRRDQREVRTALALVEIAMLGELMGDAFSENVLQRADIPAVPTGPSFSSGGSLIFVRHGYAWRFTPTDEGWDVSAWKDGEQVIDVPGFPRDAFRVASAEVVYERPPAGR